MHIKNNSLLQGYLIEADVDTCVEDLRGALSKTGDSETHLFLQDLLDVDTARHIQNFASNRGAKHFIIGFSSATVAAQNALLKVLEEPVSDTHFFVITPYAEAVLPTVRSRLVGIRWGRETNSLIDVASFLKTTKGERWEMLKEIIEERSATKAFAFLNTLEEELYQKGIEKNRKSLEGVTHAKRLLSAPGSSVRQILEYVVARVG